MNVLIYSHVFAPSIGGVETCNMLLARWLVASGRVSEAAKMRRRQGGCETRPRAVHVNGTVAVTVVTQTPASGFDDATLPFRVVRQPSLVALWRLLGEADVVHLAGPVLLPLSLSLLRRRPVVIEHHGFQAACPNGQLLYEPTRTPCPGHFMACRHFQCLRCNAMHGRLRSLRMYFLTFPRRWLCHWASANVMPTKWLATILQLPNTRVIYHGVPDNGGGLASSPSSTPMAFAFLGRLVSTKGMHILLQAAYRLKSEGRRFRLKILGNGPERAALEAQTRVLGLSDEVAFSGYVPQVMVEGHLADTAAVIMPSLAGEVFGLVAAEQMMRGRLLIAADIGGLGEVVGDAGLKFPAGDVEGLAGCLRQVLETPHLVSELRHKARERALTLFREDRMVAEHLALYEQLVKRGDPRNSERKLLQRSRN